MDEPVEKSAGSHDRRPSTQRVAVQCPDSGDPSFLDQDRGRDPLKNHQVRRSFEFIPHGRPVKGFIALGPRGLDGAAAAPVQEPELDPGFVGQEAHDAAQGVDLTDEMAFGQAPDGRIAGHLGDRIERDRHQAGLESHSRGREGRFAARVPGADDYDFEDIGG